MSKVKVSIEGHYQVEASPYGKDYVWTPAHALIECDCGQVMDADEHHTICPNCGSDHTALMREVVGRHLSEEVLHPWHRDYEEWHEATRRTMPSTRSGSRRRTSIRTTAE